MDTSTETAVQEHLSATTGLGGSEVTLTDGTRASFREVTADDETAIRDFYLGLSPRSLYLRFFSNARISIDQDVTRLLRKQPGSHEALLATIEGKVVAVGCYEVLEDPDKAEIALAVDDTHRGLGVGHAFIHRLASVASNRGIQSFLVETIRVGDPMVEVVRHLGMPLHVTEWDRGSLQFEISLPFPVSNPDAQTKQAEARS